MSKLSIAQISRASGLPYQAVYCYVKGTRYLPFERADLLEKTTGVDKLIWLEGDPAKIQAALEASKLNF